MDRRDLVEQLYNEYELLMFHVAFDILHDHHLAEDVVHECIIRLMKAKVLDIEDMHAPPTRKLIQIVARHQAYRQYSKYRKSEIHTDSENVFITSQDNDAAEYIDMKNLINTLPPIYRETIILRLYYGYSCKQVGALLGVSPQTVRNRMVLIKL